MIDVYEAEKKLITDTVWKVQQKYSGKANTAENLDRLHRELVGRLEDIGFKATVDVTPTFEGEPISVRIDERLDGVPFDGERKAWEIRKGTEKKDKTGNDIEGAM